jgi:hypothetical protein
MMAPNLYLFAGPRLKKASVDTSCPWRPVLVNANEPTVLETALLLQHGSCPVLREKGVDDLQRTCYRMTI